MNTYPGGRDIAGFVAEVMDTADLVEHIGKYVELRRAGTLYEARCPFHNEKTPSFKVSPVKGIYKCFGCGKAGNIASFYMEYFKFDKFWEAIKKIAEIENIPLPEYSSEGFQKQDIYYKALDTAATFYQRQIEPAYNHLTAERMLKDESLRKFRVGFASDSWDGLKKYMLKREFGTEGLKFGIEDLIYIGLVSLKRGANPRSTSPDDYIDFFRDRIMFPIFSTVGKIVGFGGRRNPLQDHDKSIPKYINSRENGIFKKSNILYGLNFILPTVNQTGELYLAEGYVDVIASQQNNVDAVAKLGTAFTTQHKKLIVKHANRTVVVGDNDPPGIKATKANLDSLIDLDMETSAILIPNGEDPAKFFEHNTKSDFDVIPRLDFAEFYVNTTKLDTSMSKTKALDFVIKDLKISDPVKKFYEAKKIASLFGLPEELVIRRFTDKIKTEIISASEETLFSNKTVNAYADLFVAMLIRINPKHAKSFMRSVPYDLVPKDNSIFSQRTLDFYRQLSTDYSNDNYDLSHFDIRVQEAQPTLNLFDEKEPEQPLISLNNLIKNRQLKSFPHGVMNAMNKIATDPQKPKFKIEYLANSLRTALFEKEYNELAKSLSVAIINGDEAAVSEAVARIERLHNRI